MLINTSAMQRLRRIKQLSSAHFVYPGATHTRFSHSLGVMYIAGMFAEKLLEPLLSTNSISRGEAQRYVLMMRLWGLTHDLGHGPFSHLFEDAVLSDFSITHEYMSAKILTEDPELQKCMEKINEKFGINTAQMVELLTKPREEWENVNKIGRSEHFESAFFWILKGFYSADSIEYLLRDSLFTGAGFVGFDWQRLLYTSHLHKNRIVLEKRAKEALDAFLLSRLLMFDTVYYHRTTRAFDKILADFFSKAKDEIDFEQYVNDVNQYKEMDDNIIYHEKLREIKEAKFIKNRVCTYSMVHEEPMSISPEEPGVILKLIAEKNWAHELWENSGRNYPLDAFFVDSPNIPLNPMRGETDVFLLDTKTEKTEPRKIWETFWGEMPREMFLLRLYINKQHKKRKLLARKLRKDFVNMLRSEGGFKSYA